MVSAVGGTWSVLCLRTAMFSAEATSTHSDLNIN